MSCLGFQHPSLFPGFFLISFNDTSNYNMTLSLTSPKKGKYLRLSGRRNQRITLARIKVKKSVTKLTTRDAQEKNSNYGVIFMQRKPAWPATVDNHKCLSTCGLLTTELLFQRSAFGCFSNSKIVTEDYGASCVTTWISKEVDRDVIDRLTMVNLLKRLGLNYDLPEKWLVKQVNENSYNRLAWKPLRNPRNWPRSSFFSRNCAIQA